MSVWQARLQVISASRPLQANDIEQAVCRRCLRVNLRNLELALSALTARNEIMTLGYLLIMQLTIFVCFMLVSFGMSTSETLLGCATIVPGRSGIILLVGCWL